MQEQTFTIAKRMPMLAEESVQEQIRELKGKIQLRWRDKQTLLVVSDQTIKDNNEKIKTLKEEFKDKLLYKLQTHGTHAEQNVIIKGLERSKIDQLAFQRQTAAEAIENKRSQFYGKVKQLNAILYKRIVSERKLIEMKDECNIAVLPRKSGADANFEQRKRVIGTSTDKMRLKCISAKYIQKLYGQIIQRIKKDCLTQPKRLQLLEARVRRLRSEIGTDFLSTLNESKQAFAESKKSQDMLETNIMKEKRARDRSINEIRKKFTNLKLQSAFEEREFKIRKQKTVLTSTDSANFSQKSKMSNTSMAERLKFEKVRLGLDELQRVTCVKHLSQISGCLKFQDSKTKLLFSMLEVLKQKRRDATVRKDKFLKELEKSKSEVRQISKEMRNEKDIIEEKLQRKEQEKQSLRRKLHNSESLRMKVTETIVELHTKILSWDLGAKGSAAGANVQMTGAGSKAFSTPRLLDRLKTAEKVESIFANEINIVEDESENILRTGTEDEREQDLQDELVEVKKSDFDEERYHETTSTVISDELDVDQEQRSYVDEFDMIADTEESDAFAGTQIPEENLAEKQQRQKDKFDQQSKTDFADSIESLKLLFLCKDRLLQIAKLATASTADLADMSMITMIQEIREIASHDRNSDMLASIQSRGNNSRISFGFIQNFYMENFLFHDGLDNEAYLSREMIKEREMNIVKAKTAVKRKRQKS